MNVEGIGIPFKEQVRFETYRHKKGKNKSLFLCHMELERNCNNTVSKLRYELDSYLLGLSRSKTEVIKKQTNIQKKKDLINKERCKGNSESLDFTEETPRVAGEKRVRFPPIISRSLTTLDVEQHYEVVEDSSIDAEGKGVNEVEEGRIDPFDRVPEKLYDDSKKPIKNRIADEAEKQLRLDQTRVYIERSNSIYIGMPEGSTDEKGLPKRLVLPGLLKRWKRKTEQAEQKRKKKRSAGKGLERKNTFSRMNLNLVVKSDGNNEAKKVDQGKRDVSYNTDKNVPFHMRLLMPINEEESHSEIHGDESPNPLITQAFTTKNKEETPRLGSMLRPLAARAKTREERADQDMAAIEAVREETGKMNI